MSQPDCVFCKIVSGHIPSAKVYEDENVLAFLDIGPIAKGHLLVIPKQHFATVDSCDSKVLADVAMVLPRIAKAVKEAMNVKDYNILCNNGKLAGQVVEHLHFHIIPRTLGDAIRWNWPVSKYPMNEVENLAKKIGEKVVVSSP